MSERNEVVPVPKDELEQLRADAERYRWIIANVTYMEHMVNGKRPIEVSVGGWWPQSEDDASGTVPALVGLNLDEYLKAVVA